MEIKVVQLSRKGELIKLYPSIRKAAEETGINAININHCIHHYRGAKSTGGFCWQKFSDYDMERFLQNLGGQDG